MSKIQLMNHMHDFILPRHINNLYDSKCLKIPRRFSKFSRPQSICSTNQIQLEIPHTMFFLLKIGYRHIQSRLPTLSLYILPVLSSYSWILNFKHVLYVHSIILYVISSCSPFHYIQLTFISTINVLLNVILLLTHLYHCTNLYFFLCSY